MSKAVHKTVLLAVSLCALLALACDESPRGATADDSAAAHDAASESGGPGADLAVDAEAGAKDAHGAYDVSADATQSCPNGVGGPPKTTTPPVAGSWKLTFQDDFMGSTVDDAKWKVGQHWAGFNGMASNDPRNVAVECGYLTFSAEKRANTFVNKSYGYAAAELTSFKRFRQKYGYFEARIKYDGIRGLWPAFWLMPDRGKYGNLDQNRISYIKFDLSGDSRTSVSSAALKLYVEAADTGVQNLVLLRVLDDSWKEGSVTWSTRPQPDPLWIEMKYDPKLTKGSTISFDVTGHVNQQLAGDRVVSFALVDGFLRARKISITSREGAVSANRPRLVLSGSPATVVAAEDAAVGEGSAANQKLGTQPQLHVYEAWADTASTYNGGMEFDIMESLAQWGPHMTAHALHWNGYGADHKKTGSGHVTLTATSDGFHVYGVNWQPGKVTFYVDGKQTYTWSDARVASVEAFMLLSLQMGGWKDSYGDNKQVDDPKLPGEMVMDYVRVWSSKP